MVGQILGDFYSMILGENGGLNFRRFWAVFCNFFEGIKSKNNRERSNMRLNLNLSLNGWYQTRFVKHFYRERYA